MWWNLLGFRPKIENSVTSSLIIISSDYPIITGTNNPIKPKKHWYSKSHARSSFLFGGKLWLKLLTIVLYKCGAHVLKLWTFPKNLILLGLKILSIGFSNNDPLPVRDFLTVWEVFSSIVWVLRSFSHRPSVWPRSVVANFLFLLPIFSLLYAWLFSCSLTLFSL